ncbi:MAG: DUF1501 domain-containing protein [Pseudomonadota bacterium]|nr:DUF1501 domain-containing protein [Pseudomonadota bacterium]
MNTRRRWIQSLLAGAALAPWVRLSVAAPASPNNSNRFVFVVLRGGMDGLTAAPVPGDPAFAAARGVLADFSDFGTAPLPLAGPFTLHPLLPQLQAMYGARELTVVHAVGLPYRERSHFDAQQVLESGGSRPYELTSGWLGRAVAASGRGGAAPGLRAVALETAVPLVLRGPAEVDTWSPSALAEPSGDLVARLALMYRGDAALSGALQRARGLRGEPGSIANPSANPSTATQAAAGPKRSAAVTLAAKAAEFLQSGSQVAVLDMAGWDSHANQGTAGGATSNNLRALDASLAALREGLLPNGLWAQTVVVVATEFGREVSVNGTHGTDHGSGGVAFVVGGAVAGGRVLADWPGLATKDRYEGRDLRITTDLRTVLRNVLGEHLQVSRSALDRDVLPGSAALPRLQLLRT